MTWWGNISRASRQLHAQLLTCMVIALFTGCASIGASRSGRVELRMAPSGIVMPDGRLVPLRKTGDALRRKGYGAQTTVEVLITDSFQEAALAALTTNLHRAGFRRLIFKTPTQVESLSEPTRR